MCDYEKLSLGVQLAVAFGTVLAVVVAIWRDAFQAWLAGPKLSVRLRHPEGHMTRAGETPVRYYQLEVSNGRAWAPAKGVQVLLFDVLCQDPGDSWQSIMPTRPIPFSWSFEAILGDRQEIGPEHLSDLLRVSEDGGAALCIRVTPHNLEWKPTSVRRARLVVGAVAEKAQSPRISIDFWWDGQWNVGTAEMARHLRLQATDAS